MGPKVFLKEVGSSKTLITMQADKWFLFGVNKLVALYMRRNTEKFATFSTDIRPLLRFKSLMLL